MSKKAARNLFIGGTIFFFAIFIGLTVDTMKQVAKRTPTITDAVDRGKMTWQKYDCIGCHTILGNGSYFAPDLTKVVDKKPEGYLVKWLTDPKSVRKDATMPKLGISESEALDLIAFLEWNSKVDTNDWPPKPLLAQAASAGATREVAPGEIVYQQAGCVACHTLSGIGGTTGPELTKVGQRHEKEWFETWLADPQSVKPGTAMPSFSSLGDDKIEALAAYLSSLR